LRSFGLVEQYIQLESRSRIWPNLETTPVAEIAMGYGK
jgi:hypothetical protein